MSALLPYDSQIRVLWSIILYVEAAPVKVSLSVDVVLLPGAMFALHTYEEMGLVSTHTP